MTGLIVMVSPLRYEVFVLRERHGLSAPLRGICATRTAWSLRFATRYLCYASGMVSPLRYEVFVLRERHERWMSQLCLFANRNLLMVIRL